MGYQETLIKSKIVPLKAVSSVIRKTANPMFLNSADIVATLKKGLTSDKVILFGQERQIKPLYLKNGEQFLVVCGDRHIITSSYSLFPAWIRKTLEIIPIEVIIQSPENINKRYDEVFSDSKLSDKNPLPVFRAWRTIKREET